MKHKLIWRSVLLLACGIATAADVPADRPPDFVPLGVYLSWERPKACAAHYKIDRWEDVRRRLDVIAEHHVDTLWVTNMADTDLPRLIRECETRGIRLLPSMSTVECKIKWRWHKGGKYYDAVIPRVLKLAGDSKALVGWVLSDEPSLDDLPRVEELRRRFREADPNRFCLVVSMWPQTPKVPEMTGLPVICVDLYPFFGPNDPNGPHTDRASRIFFRKNARRMVEAIGERNAVPWIMAMCFNSIWGPRKYDSRGHLIGLPGSYLHWRCPTLAEIRWQVWETLRSGCKGIIIYTLCPEPPDPETETLPPSDVAKRNPKIVLAKGPTDLGPNALTNPDGTPTPQLKELGKAYKLLGPHRTLIRRWKAAASPIADTKAPAQIQCFIDPATGRHYAVVVNDDLHRARPVDIILETRVKKLFDIVRRKEIELVDDRGNGRRRSAITLAAGEGTILEATIEKDRER